MAGSIPRNIRLKDLRDWMIGELEETYDPREARRLIEWVFHYLAGIDSKDFILHPDLELEEAQLKELSNALDDLIREVPVQYITGRTEFYGLSLEVDKRVLIPRPETEELVKWVLDDHPDDCGCSILDIGTGSGCIAIALKAQLPYSHIFAIDHSENALIVAESNSRQHSAGVVFQCADILDPGDLFPGIFFDVIVSNPPYVTEAERKDMHRNVLEHEPENALFVPEQDPLVYYRAIAEFSKRRLSPSGQVYVEINEQFGALTMQTFREQGFNRLLLRQDLNGKDRMIRAGI